MAWMSTGQGPLFWCQCQDLPTCVCENKNLPYSSRQRNWGEDRDILEMPEWEIYDHRLILRIEKNFDWEENMDFVYHPGPDMLYDLTLKYCRDNSTFSERRNTFAVWKLLNWIPSRYYSLCYLRLASDGEDKRYSTRAYDSRGCLHADISIYLRYIWKNSICNDCDKFTPGSPTYSLIWQMLSANS